LDAPEEVTVNPLNASTNLTVVYVRDKSVCDYLCGAEDPFCINFTISCGSYTHARGNEGARKWFCDNFGSGPFPIDATALDPSYTLCETPPCVIYAPSLPIIETPIGDDGSLRLAIIKYGRRLGELMGMYTEQGSSLSSRDITTVPDETPGTNLLRKCVLQMTTPSQCIRYPDPYPRPDNPLPERICPSAMRVVIRPCIDRCRDYKQLYDDPSAYYDSIQDGLSLPHAERNVILTRALHTIQSARDHVARSLPAATSSTPSWMFTKFLKGVILQVEERVCDKHPTSSACSVMGRNPNSNKKFVRDHVMTTLYDIPLDCHVVCGFDYQKCARLSCMDRLFDPEGQVWDFIRTLDDMRHQFCDWLSPTSAGFEHYTGNNVLTYINSSRLDLLIGDDIAQVDSYIDQWPLSKMIKMYLLGKMEDALDVKFENYTTDEVAIALFARALHKNSTGMTLQDITEWTININTNITESSVGMWFWLRALGPFPPDCASVSGDYYGLWNPLWFTFPTWIIDSFLDLLERIGSVKMLAPSGLIKDDGDCHLPCDFTYPTSPTCSCSKMSHYNCVIKNFTGPWDSWMYLWNKWAPNAAQSWVAVTPWRILGMGNFATKFAYLADREDYTECEFCYSITLWVAIFYIILLPLGAFMFRKTIAFAIKNFVLWIRTVFALWMAPLSF
jgi:hypothetical protein